MRDGVAPAADVSGLPIAFGPIRSRRFGWSLGVNNVPLKTCTYACVYCQVGATTSARGERAAFFGSEAVVAAVAERLAACREAGQAVDVVTFVPDGEPTLDRDLGDAIRGIARLGAHVAILTNASLTWRDDVRDDLAAADQVSLKVDTVHEEVWTRLNRPIGRLHLDAVLDGMRRFARDYRGDLTTETLLVAGLNDEEASLRATAAFVGALEPLRAYVAVPTRPPAEPWVRAPSIETVRHAAEIFRGFDVPVSCLIKEIAEDEGPFPAPGDAASGLLGIVAVHPMTISAARDFIARAGGDWSAVEALIEGGRIARVRHAGRTYLRASSRPCDRPGSVSPGEGQASADRRLA